MGPPETALLVFVGLLVLALLLGVLSLSARPRKPKYDLVRSASVSERSPSSAGLPGFPRHELGQVERERFALRWGAVQTRFVDDPVRAVQDAERLTRDLLRVSGYAANDGAGAQHYRAARMLTEANDEAPVDTEELRQAIVHYRALFGEVLARSRGAQEAHA